ncbi:uncharacterized protein HaLaN_28421 [Haematococcus lacustris]|uniref:Uncharacterized protein n=1 Tax=Haematococcus lacustris TaxID=44745 RepID=A0A6A0AAS9_HAELA|nr:uncharacterized protein HaLaN_28421 [Haematococcus lacustris]
MCAFKACGLVPDPAHLPSGSHTPSYPACHNRMSCRVPIPRDLIALMTRDQKASLWQRQSEISELELSSAEMRAIFKESVKEVCRLAVRQLKAARRNEGAGPCSVVLLVGGFARSSYLEAKVRAAVRGLADKVVVPPGCHTAVMAGAVQYGFNPARIHARRSRMAYGVKTCAQWTEGAPGKFWHQEKCDYMTNCKFQCYVKKDELVAHDQEVVHYFKPLYKTLEEVDVKLFACDNNAVEFVEDDAKGTQPLTLTPLTVQVPEYSDTADRAVCVKFNLGLTEVCVSALNKATGSYDAKIIPFPQARVLQHCLHERAKHMVSLGSVIRHGTTAMCMQSMLMPNMGCQPGLHEQCLANVMVLLVVVMLYAAMIGAQEKAASRMA